MNYTDFLKQEFPALLESLNEEHQPLWGLMNPQQMVEHLGMVLLISNGKSQYTTENINLERMAKSHDFFFKEKQPFPKNVRVKSLPEIPAPPYFPDLATAKAKLMAELARFDDYFDKNPDAKPLHPAFGYLSHEEWKDFHARHILHHFQQFNLVK